MTIYEKTLSKAGVIPVAVMDDPDKAVLTADALIRGGLPCVEVTFRTDAAEESIKLISKTFPQMMVGAGTVISIEQVKRAAEAGAGFIVSPGFDDEVVQYCLLHDIPIFPGCVTPSEIMQAVKRGLSVLKFFPSEQFGGLEAINALGGPFPNVKFIPTGGINTDNLAAYLKSDRVFACGGTWLLKKNLIQNGEFEKIRTLAAQAVEIVKKERGGK